MFDDATGTLWLADLLFMERAPVIDGNLLGWLEVLDTVAGWRESASCRGMGRRARRGAAADQVRYLERLRDDIRALIAAGGTIEEAVANAGGEAPPGSCSSSTTRATSPPRSPSWNGNELRQWRICPADIGRYHDGPTERETSG